MSISFTHVAPTVQVVEDDSGSDVAVNSTDGFGSDFLLHIDA
jgi:hypothetical protein